MPFVIFYPFKSRQSSHQREIICSLVELRKNKYLVKSEPDKVNGTVIQNKYNFVEKKECILGDGNNFKKNTEVIQSDLEIRR